MKTRVIGILLIGIVLSLVFLAVGMPLIQKARQNKTDESTTQQTAVTPTPRASGSFSQLANNKTQTTTPTPTPRPAQVTGWKKAYVKPQVGAPGIEFIYYYPPSLYPQHTDQLAPADSLDTITQPISVGQSTTYDRIITFSTIDTGTFEDAVQNAIPGAEGEPKIEEFATPSGLAGSKISAETRAFNTTIKYVVYILKTGRKSATDNDIFIKASGTYGYMGGAGKGTYTGSIETIESMVKSISL